MAWRKDVWDPLLILAQITSLQSVYYIILGLSFIFLDYSSDHSPTLEQFFNPQLVSFDTVLGVMTILGIISSSFLV